MTINIKGILKGTGLFFAYVFTYVFLLLSLLPLVQWWAGLLALFLAAGLYYLLYMRQKEKKEERSPHARRFFRLAVYMVIFGVVLHLGCRVYSGIRVGALYDECQQQKKQAFGKKKSSAPDSKKAAKNSNGKQKKK